MLLRRGAVILSAFLVVVSCQKQQDLLQVLPEPSTYPNPNLGLLEFLFNADDNSAILFGYELIERIRAIQVECVVLKHEEELEFNSKLEGLMLYHQQTKNKFSKQRDDISEEEKERIETNFRDAFGDMNEERTDELASMQRDCDKRLKHLLDSKKMEAIGYAEALLRTDPAKFTELCFEITDFRRQVETSLDTCLQLYEGKFGADPADLCYEDAINVLLEFTHQFIVEISQLPQQIYGDDEDFVDLHIPGSGEGVMGSGEEPIPRVTHPSVPAPPAENRPSPPIDEDSREIVRLHLPTKAPSPGKTTTATDKQPSPEPPTGTRGPTKIRVVTPTDEQPSSQPPAISEGPRKTPPSTDERPYSAPTKGPTKIRVFTPTDEQPSSPSPIKYRPSQPTDEDSREIVRLHQPTEPPPPGKTPPATDEQPYSAPTKGPTNIRIFTPTDEQPSSRPPTTAPPTVVTSRVPTTGPVVTKATLPPVVTFRTRPTEVGPTVPGRNRVSRPTPPSKTEDPRKELPTMAVDQGVLDEEEDEESSSPEVEGTLEIDLPGVGVDVQVEVEDDGVEVDVDVTTETPQDGDESENVPNTAGTVEIISDYDSEESSEHRRPESSSKHLPSEVQSQQVHFNTDETEELSDDDSGSKEGEGDEEEEKFSYQHILIYAFMIVGSLLVIVIVILIIAILAVRRRRNRFKDTPLLSEEQKVAVMKQTGYVNPTYKFFDQVNDS